MQQADFVIIGSGSAGSALAYRLSEDGKNSVIVIEAGGSDFGPFIQMPAALAWPMSMKRYNWGYLSEPEANLNNRRITAPRGKVIGGSSSINGMVYVRGHAEDFNRWEELGASGFGPMPTCFPISSGWNIRMAAKRAGAAPTGRCMSSAAASPIRSSKPSSRPANRRVSRRRKIITAASRKASG